MANRDRQTITFTLAIAAILLAVAFLLPHVVHGDTGSSQGILDTSGWRSAEYSLAQCGPSGCGPSGCGVGIGIGIERWQTPPRPQYRPPSQPQQPTARLPAIANQVTVIVRVPDSTGASVGSGVVVGVNLVLTAYHVIKDTQGTVQVGNGIQATILAYDATWDLALLRTVHPFGTYATLANYRPAVGERLFSGGYASGGPLHWTVGAVTEYNRPMSRNEPDWLVVVSGNRSGDSGGPIFNAAGQVVGICWGAVDNQARATVCTRIWQVFGSYLSVSAPADTTPGTQVPLPGGTPSTGTAGANMEQLAERFAASIESLHTELAAIKARESTIIRQEVTQSVALAVTAQIGNQLIDKELVPLKQSVADIARRQEMYDQALGGYVESSNERLGKLELQQQALQLLVEAGGGKGEKGDTGPAGQDAVVDMEELVERLRPLVVSDLQKTDDVPRKPDEWPLPQKPVYYDIRPRRSGG